jgi:hypothetical protein
VIAKHEANITDTGMAARMLMWDSKAEFHFQDSMDFEREGMSDAASMSASYAHTCSQYASAIEGEFDTRPAIERTSR